MSDTLNLDIVQGIDGWGYGFDEIAASLKQFKGSKINLPINSYGGSVMEGLSIYNLLYGHPAQVEANILTFAMSMGTIVAMAGDSITMPENGFFMIHNPAGGVLGEEKDMAKMATLLATFKSTLVGVYHRKTGIPKDEISAMMDETWLTAQQALEMGFITGISEKVTIEAKFDPKEYSNLPVALREDNSKTKNDNKMSKDNFFGGIISLFTNEKNSEEVTAEQALGTLAEKLGPTISESVGSIVDEKVAAITNDIEAKIAQSAEGVASASDYEKLVSENTALKTKVTELEEMVSEIKAAQENSDAIVAKLAGKKPVGKASHVVTGTTGKDIIGEVLTVSTDDLRAFMS